MNKPFKSIGFDLDNTLIDRDHAFLNYAKHFVDGHPNPGRKSDSLALIHEILVADDHGYRDRADFCQWMARRFPMLNLSPHDIWTGFSSTILDHIKPSRPVIRLLSGLEKRFHLFVITNGSGKLQRGKLERAGIAHFFKDVFISGETGFAKPDRRMFEMALETADLAPGEILYVGDDPVCDMAGAAAAGMKTCWVSMDRPAPFDMPAPDYETPAIRDFKEIVSC